ncbi:hypothetical protein BJ166DRAFT_109429 [Pestalotiopsis sp. NC0098]|nr:hypothetical protein BJ166DRAFT_109429 [Pestalotiopsis sp. NC0098]
MKFSTAGIALCAIQAVASSAIEPRQALACTSGDKVATYNDLTAIPVDDGNTGLTSAQLNPYKDLNYTRFSVISKSSTDNVIFYTLSRISAGTLSSVQYVLSSRHPDSCFPCFVLQTWALIHPGKLLIQKLPATEVLSTVSWARWASVLVFPKF